MLWRNGETSKIGYNIVFDDIIDAARFVPQHRERIYIVGFRKPVKFGPLNLRGKPQRIKNILDKKVDAKYTLTDHLWAYLQNYAAKHKA